MMRRFGLIGYPLSHSFSAGYFTHKFENEFITESVYENFSIDSIDQFPGLLKAHTDFAGLNVTIPYKERIIPFLDELDETAKAVGAVNTIKFMKDPDGKLWLEGYNTDVYGFENSLNPYLSDYHRNALILGTGGASKAIKYILNKKGIQFVSASIEELKENEIRYQDIDKTIMDEHLLIIHCTPLGTYPKIDTCPDIPYEFITSKHVLYDLVYNPEETLFLKNGKERGAKITNGLKMLHLQAEKAWEIWNE
jgi:shikimate dehydrogenase